MRFAITTAKGKRSCRIRWESFVTSDNETVLVLVGGILSEIGRRASRRHVILTGGIDRRPRLGVVKNGFAAPTARDERVSIFRPATRSLLLIIQ